MANLIGRKVSILKMHALAHVPNAGQFDTTIDVAKTKEAFGQITITIVDEGGVLVESSKGWSLFIPNGNIVSALLTDK